MNLSASWRWILHTVIPVQMFEQAKFTISNLNNLSSSYICHFQSVLCDNCNWTGWVFGHFFGIYISLVDMLHLGRYNAISLSVYQQRIKMESNWRAGVKIERTKVKDQVRLQWNAWLCDSMYWNIRQKIGAICHWSKWLTVLTRND